MPRPKRQFLATAEETLSPPSTLDPGLAIARVAKSEGKNLYTVQDASSGAFLVELPAKFRSSIWIKKGSFVVVNQTAFEGRENKIGGEIVNIVGDEKAWRKMAYWPSKFSKRALMVDSDDENSKVGKMPPSDESESEVS